MKTPRDARIAEYDDPKLYSGASGLRQQKDAAWVLGLLPTGNFRSCMDLGCGNGDFLAELLVAGRVSHRIAGLDRSEAMILAAQARFSPTPPELELMLQHGDILEPPKFMGKFDLVTMLAVQHWLYPREADAYRWICSLLEDTGIFCLTTYHPAVDAKQVGGTDEVVLEAMGRIGAATDFPPGFLPIGQRARSASELTPILQRYFQIVSMAERQAVTRAENAEQFTKYHVATFGSYYSQLLAADDRPPFLESIGQAAMKRMQTLGYVTSMDVRCWICRRKHPANPKHT